MGEVCRPESGPGTTAYSTFKTPPHNPERPVRCRSKHSTQAITAPEGAAIKDRTCFDSQTEGEQNKSSSHCIDDSIYTHIFILVVVLITWSLKALSQYQTRVLIRLWNELFRIDIPSRLS